MTQVRLWVRNSPVLRGVMASDRLGLYAGTLALLSIWLVVGYHIVPAHWASIWMDYEFSGWVAPISNRLGSSQQLYADGAHLPVAPLAYVLTHVLTMGNAVWLTESALCFTCQSLAVLTLYAGFYRLLPWPAPLVAAFALTFNFTSLPKIMLYDGLAQLGATVGAVLAMRGLLACSTERVARMYLLLAGVASACTLLAKQNTGGGLIAGVVLAIWVAGSAASWKDRLKSTLLYGVGTLSACVVLLLSMTPWIDLGGFVQDVLLTSTEVKGGPRMMLTRLGNFSRTVWLNALTLSVPPVAVAVALMAWAALQHRDAEDRSVGRGADWLVLPSALGALIGSATCMFGAIGIGLGYGDVALQASFYVAVACVVVDRLRGHAGPGWMAALWIFTCITLPAALAHNLSVNELRWTYDNNALIWLPLAFAAAATVQVAGRQSQVVKAWLAGALLTFSVQTVAAGTFFLQWVRAQACSEYWPEVAFLRGARLRPEAQGMRDVVSAVRHFAPRETDEVLLLPNDPNVEAWFERARPRVSSAMLFADQYWDRYVEHDFELLKREPPRVIVVGPRNYWRHFMHIVQPDRATDRLGGLIVHELLPRRYGLVAEVPIKFDAGDFMDVYVLKGE